MQSNMRGRRPSRKSTSSESTDEQNENSTLTQRKFNVQYHEIDVSDTDRKGKRKRCFSKNAVMARMNRLRKKKYLENLQSNFAAVSEENIKLKDTVNRQSKLVKTLKNEIIYLRNVVANSKELGMLLKSVSHNTGLPTRSSLIKAKPELEPQTKGDASLDNFPLDSRCSSRASKSDMQSEDTNFDDLFPVNLDLLPLEDVILSSAMSNDNVLDLDLLSSNNAASELVNKNCTENIMDLSGSEILNGPALLNDTAVLNDVAELKTMSDDAELFTDVGVCLHVAKKKVSLEFCSRCNNNANKAWVEEIVEDSK